MTLDDCKSSFDSIWLVDFEYRQPDGDLPLPHCLVAHEIFSERRIKQWLNADITPVIPLNEKSLFVSYYAIAEISCYLSLNWPLPNRLLDLYVEFKNYTNGKPIPSNHGLLGALDYFGISGIASVEKGEMRELAMRGSPYTMEEKAVLLDYCESDIKALKKVFFQLLPHIDLPHALMRGRYMMDLAKVERRGIPIDMEKYNVLTGNWDHFKQSLVKSIDVDFGVYDGLTFKRDRFKKYLDKHKIPWPLLDTGELSLRDDTFKEQAKLYPVLMPLKEIRATLSQLRLTSLTIGKDGRNRCMLSPFQSRTGRNQPSNSKYIFGPAVWIRNLIKPPTGKGIAYVDWSAQEFAIAAYLSKDNAMMEAYRSGDPYLFLAKAVGAVPTDATKKTHGAIRDRYKICTLGVQYGMSGEGIARKLGIDTIYGRELLNHHQRTYPQYWAWSETRKDMAQLRGYLQTVFGWTLHVVSPPNLRSISNFPMQANGAEMMRLAIIFCGQNGVEVIAPVHDALMIEFDSDKADSAVEKCQQLMRKASEQVLPGFPLRTDAKIFLSNYSDERGKEIWNKLWQPK